MFFATANDIINTFDDMSLFGEQRYKLIRLGFYDTDEIQEFESVRVLPNLGYTSSDSHLSENYLIIEKDVCVMPEQRTLNDGSVKYLVHPWNIDQAADTAVLTLSPGGVSHDGTSLIHAQIATNCDNEKTQELFRVYQNSMRRHFIRAHGGWLLGRDALDTYYNKLRFVSIGTGEPTGYDFRFKIDRLCEIEK